MESESISAVLEERFLVDQIVDLISVFIGDNKNRGDRVAKQVEQ
jgi:hypothetical protein